MFILLQWARNEKCERPNESRGNKPYTKINPKAPGKCQVSINILKSMRIFCIVILQDQVILHIIAFKICICIQQWPRQHYNVRDRNKSISKSELQLNLQKHINVCCCSFNKISIKGNITLQDNYNVTIILTFFDLITFESLMVSVWNLVRGRFINCKNGRKTLNLLIYVCPIGDRKQV